MELVDLEQHGNDHALELIFGSKAFADIKDRVGVWLIGGAARSLFTGEPIKDYDFVFTEYESLVLFKNTLYSLGAKKIAETESASTPGKRLCEDFIFRWGKKQEEYAYIQLKHEFYSSPVQQFDWADFTICHFAKLYGREDRLVASAIGYEDYTNKRLRFHKVSSPLATLIRIPKYINRGFSPQNDVAFYSEIIGIIQAMPVNHAGFKPKRKAYLKDWKEKFNVR